MEPVAGHLLMRVLLVEDDLGHGDLIIEAFGDEAPDAEIHWAQTVAEAIEALEKRSFDVLLVDVNLPDGTCLDILHHPARVRVPALVLTAQGAAGIAVQAMKAGALDYLEKSPSMFDALPKLAASTARENVASLRLAHAEESLRHANRLIGAGRLAALTAHEVGTPLNVVRMGLQGLQRERPDGKGGDIGELIEQIDLISGRLRGMLDYSRAPRPRRRVLPLVHTTKEAVRLLGPLLRRSGTEVDVSGEEVYLAADAEQLHQVVFNLLANASHAGAKRIAVSCEEAESGVYLRFRDDGPGVPDELRDRLFDAFFTTKEAGKGTGLGLAVCSQIAVEHGGHLALEPSVSGAVFALFLPRA